MRQIHNRGNYDLTEAEYLQIVEAKTAQLCACCCELGAHYAGADLLQQRRCQEYGRNLGIAFQIVDDILDLVGDPDCTGKSLGTDLEKEKMTLPFIRLLDTSDETRRTATIQRMSRPSSNARSELRDLLQDSDALEYAGNVASRYAQMAQDQLDGLPNGPARQALLQLTSFVLARHH
jgi:octaprenyl-diphosphate synthase